LPHKKLSAGSICKAAGTKAGNGKKKSTEKSTKNTYDLKILNKRNSVFLIIII
jgi:hypothetical protein